MQNDNLDSRREFMIKSIMSTGLLASPYVNCGKLNVTKPMTRSFGRLGFEVTTLGLGGQASIQWTPAGVDPIAIIHKAFQSGINYFDTSNVYGPSQRNYGVAFRELGLVPGLPGYRESKRRAIFLTSKTGLRLSKGEPTNTVPRGFTEGPESYTSAIQDVKRSLSQIFGDGEGAYPKGAYLDMVLIHALESQSEIETLYLGLEDTSPDMEVIGALAGLRDLRDGTNLTGLNPGEEKLIRHVGFSGHFSAPIMMEMIQRDAHDLIDGMLVAINANDRLYQNMQHNVIPVAQAKNIGVIAMKTFADGAMYTKNAHFSYLPEHVIRSVGSPSLPSRHLIEYSLTTAGVHTLITGIGQISDDPQLCQLTQNLSAAQVRAEEFSPSDRQEIEEMTRFVKNGATNYFQDKYQGLTPPRQVAVMQGSAGDQRIYSVTWQSAYAGAEPIRTYEIWRDQHKIAEVPNKPQTDLHPFVYKDAVTDDGAHNYKVVAVDAKGDRR
ncbi:aldo/keto reductase [candidate division KSB1 bacterium]|nr:aldo/keto reductase [candidate division KSB1 bacterium]RQW02468.1 MAG: aldo/keto reductase [candidate division KSB1 bacterium]